MNKRNLILILTLCLAVSAFGFSPVSADAKSKTARIYVEIMDYYKPREYMKPDTYKYNEKGYKGTLKLCGRSAWWEWKSYVKYCGYAYKKI